MVDTSMGASLGSSVEWHYPSLMIGEEENSFLGRMKIVFCKNPEMERNQDLVDKVYLVAIRSESPTFVSETVLRTM